MARVGKDGASHCWVQRAEAAFREFFLFGPVTSGLLRESKMQLLVQLLVL